MTESASTVAPRPRGLVLAVAMAVVLAGLVLGSVLVPTQSAYGREEAVASIALLGQSASSADELPPGFPLDAHGDGGIDPSSVRLLGESDGSVYWTARDRRGQVCVLAQSIAVPDETVGSCLPPRTFEAQGAPIEVSGRWSLSAILLPDSANPAAATGEAQVVAPNLLVLDPDATADEVRVPRDRGASGAVLVVSSTLGAQG